MHWMSVSLSWARLQGESLIQLRFARVVDEMEEPESDEEDEASAEEDEEKEDEETEASAPAKADDTDEYVRCFFGISIC